MAAPSKTKKIEQLVKLLQKRYKGLSVPQDRPVLDQLIYAALLENASQEQADSAIAVLEGYFIDWNEVRVSTVPELADTFLMLPDPMAAGERVRRTLQAVFEKTYSFDLEDLRKKGKNLGQTVEFLESLAVCSRFMIDYVTQFAFAGHVIPLDEAALRIFRLLGLTQVNKDRTKEEVSGLERAVPKKNGAIFSVQLHQFAACYYSSPHSDELRSLLGSIDAEALKRDWTPPVLVLPKATPISAKPDSPKVFPVPLPFVAADEDDFEDDQIGTEAEFISGEDELEPKTSAPGERKTASVSQKLEPALPVKSGTAEGKKKSKSSEKIPAESPKPEKSGAGKSNTSKPADRTPVKKDPSGEKSEHKTSDKPLSPDKKEKSKPTAAKKQADDKKTSKDKPVDRPSTKSVKPASKPVPKTKSAEKPVAKNQSPKKKPK